MPALAISEPLEAAPDAEAFQSSPEFCLGMPLSGPPSEKNAEDEMAPEPENLLYRCSRSCCAEAVSASKSPKKSVEEIAFLLAYLEPTSLGSDLYLAGAGDTGDTGEAATGGSALVSAGAAGGGGTGLGALASDSSSSKSKSKAICFAFAPAAAPPDLGAEEAVEDAMVSAGALRTTLLVVDGTAAGFGAAGTATAGAETDL
mmetsp:Transcript_14606/g.31948  ORF Transcript_14606/g.31948 Transcript_14606/m.31948 type:complete len:202 (-) Transcript_14606:643-1248(-)